MGLKEALNNRSDNPLLRDMWAKMHTVLIVPFSYMVQPAASFFGKPGSSVLPNNPSGDAAFIGKIMAANLATSTASAVSITVEAAVAEALFVSGKLWYYKFLLNPNNVKIGHQKLQTIEETSDLTIINTYRNQASTLSFTGISGCTLPRDFMLLTGQDTALPIETMARYPKLSAAWIKFRQLEKFYTDINSDIIIVYDMDLYIGKFVNLNYSQDANNPWVINYDMTIKAYPEMVLHTFSVYDYAPFFSAILDRYGKSFSTDFEGVSTPVATAGTSDASAGVLL